MFKSLFISKKSKTLGVRVRDCGDKRNLISSYFMNKTVWLISRIKIRIMFVSMVSGQMCRNTFILK